MDKLLEKLAERTKDEKERERLEEEKKTEQEEKAMKKLLHNIRK